MADLENKDTHTVNEQIQTLIRELYRGYHFYL